MITDKAIVRSAHVGKKHLVAPLITAVSQTDKTFYLKKLGYPFELLKLAGYCALEAGAVTANAVILDPISVLTAPVVTVHATPEDLAVAAWKALVGGVVVEKAQTDITAFTAAHKITATLWGTVLIQMSAAGTYSTKVPLATQAYATSGEAWAARSLPDTGQIAVAYLTIQADASVDWDANTDDMTAGSDLDVITITNAVVTSKVSSAGVAFASLSEVVATLSSTIGHKQGGADDYLALVYTSDGTGVLTNGSVTVTVRPMKMGGDTRNE